MNIEEMKQVLDALHCIESPLYVREIVKVGKAMGILRQAIEEAEKQKPVCDKDPQGCWYVRCQLGKQCKNLAQPAQKRPWVGLTDEDMRLCLAVADYNQGRYKRTQYWAHLATAIDAKLREKNEC